jgi:hypothetical protein
MVALSADRSGEVTIKLQQASSSNSYLQSLVDQQEAGADTFVPVSVLFQDTYRNDLAEASNGYTKKTSDLKRGAGLNANEWTFVLEDLSFAFGS